MPVLVTGGMGFIGSHTCVELINHNFEVIILDNLKNSRIDILDRIEKITGKRPVFYKVDLLNKNDIEKIFYNHKIESVIHLAGLKSVSESFHFPLQYYQNNVIGTLNLCEVMSKYQVKKLVFSSSATVYGNKNISPLKENMHLEPTNPYGNTKLIVEKFLGDLVESDSDWSIAVLRYFNPVGAHESGMIGEKPTGTPANLMPYITQVAAGKRKELKVYGNDYDTHDGTGIRDYIHIMDVAVGHLKALEMIQVTKGVKVYNLGTGKGYSVLDVIKTFEETTGQKVRYSFSGRRKGDIAVCYADVTKARNELGWEAKRSLTEMCRDAWNWELKSDY